MMGRISSDAVSFSYDDSSETEPRNGMSNNFNNLLDIHLSGSKLGEGKEVEIDGGVHSTLSTDGEKKAEILLRALIFRAAQLEDNVNETRQQKIKEILGALSNEEIEFASQELEKNSVVSTESEELPTILPTMEEIDAFLEESMLSKAS